MSPSEFQAWNIAHPPKPDAKRAIEYLVQGSRRANSGGWIVNSVIFEEVIRPLMQLNRDIEAETHLHRLFITTRFP